MIRTGDSIANPVTGETVTFQQTAADSDGEVVIAEVTLEPGGSVPGLHVHPNQTETFRIIDGAVGFRVGRRRRIATTGETVVVEAGTAHAFWNAATGQAHFLCEIRPALGFERLLETMFALARDGKTNRQGVPHPLAWPRSPTTTTATSNSPSSPSPCSEWPRSSVQPPPGPWPSSAPPTTAPDQPSRPAPPSRLRRLSAPSTHRGQPHDQPGTHEHDHPTRPARRRHRRTGRNHRQRHRHPGRRLRARTGNTASDIHPRFAGTRQCLHV